MVKPFVLLASPRVACGRNAVKKLRARGCIPAIFYGVSDRPYPIMIKRREVERILAHAIGENLLVELQVNAQEQVWGDGTTKRLSLIQEVQHHPIHGDVLHVDFLAVSTTSKIEVEIPLEPKGEAKGVKSGGGLLEQSLRVLLVECLPQNLPEVIQIDITALDVGDSYHVKDIILPDGVRSVTNPGLAVFQVSEPAIAAITSSDSTFSPEVIREKKLEASHDNPKGT